ncbi:hypothetical protein NE237_032883 [Protea cynaroides]|uniref:Uncharacterized protein n=1 Tax=Protea cynaroides TaxID=273540 RepID=A0A9Q0L4D0_9MAGN|nr:hypothetical protein NE237_032883 [Protea cynaroides]
MRQRHSTADLLPIPKTTLETNCLDPFLLSILGEKVPKSTKLFVKLRIHTLFPYLRWALAGKQIQSQGGAGEQIGRNGDARRKPIQIQRGGGEGAGPRDDAIEKMKKSLVAQREEKFPKDIPNARPAIFLQCSGVVLFLIYKEKHLT